MIRVIQLTTNVMVQQICDHLKDQWWSLNQILVRYSPSVISANHYYIAKFDLSQIGKNEIEGSEFNEADN